MGVQWVCVWCVVGERCVLCGGVGGCVCSALGFVSGVCVRMSGIWVWDV